MKKIFLFIMAVILFMGMTNNDCYGQRRLPRPRRGKGRVTVETPHQIKRNKPVTSLGSHGNPSASNVFRNATKGLDNTTKKLENQIKAQKSKERMKRDLQPADLSPLRRSRETFDPIKQLQENFIYPDPYLLPEEIKSEYFVDVSLSANQKQMVVSTIQGVVKEVDTKTSRLGWRQEKKETQKKKKEKEHDADPSDIKIPIPPLCKDCQCTTSLYDLE